MPKGIHRLSDAKPTSRFKRSALIEIKSFRQDAAFMDGIYRFLRRGLRHRSAFFRGAN